MIFYCLCSAAATALAASGPVLPGVATPAEDHLGAVEVGVAVARSVATVAAGPVEAVDLPEADVDAAVAVKVAGVEVTAGLGLGDALAAGLTPARVLGAPVADVGVAGAAAGAAAAVGCVGLSCKSSGESKEENEDSLQHFLLLFLLVL